ncbi:hypothetical protein CI109_107314 [Kwoniella shandongensis]|uniref:Uncharacterized protein n=1 Tax=Kwoniella shandongensis TaxID=1734106 RepID=A0A5M6BXE2_9TREE|nr:uncharacterized protein CI109_004758 [Kwoniella shandongensis]KAA5526981.1 hypothetical protein CI109_004758 [Kwoniella shandongensis]
MGKWSESQYDRVLVTKVMQLFEHAVQGIDEDGSGSPIPDKRFRTFITKLDENDRLTQHTFKNLVLVSNGKAPIRRLGLRHSHAESNTPRPVPFESLPIYYDGPSHLRGRRFGDGQQPLLATAVNNTSAPTYPWESNVDFSLPSLDANSADRARSAPTSPGLAFESHRPTPLERRPSPPIPLFFPQFSSPLAQSPSGLRVRHSDIASTISDDDGATVDNGQVAEDSTVSSSSHAWLEEYRREQQANSNRSAQSSRPTLQRVRPSRTPLTYSTFAVNYDSDQTEVPDEFDNLLNNATNSANRMARRRRREAEDEGDADARITRRARIHAPLTDIRREWEGNGDSWLENYRTVPRWSSAVSSTAEIRDTRRDGIIFDADLFGSIDPDHVLSIDGDDQTSGQTYDTIAARHREMEPQVIRVPVSVDPGSNPSTPSRQQNDPSLSSTTAAPEVPQLDLPSASP